MRNDIQGRRKKFYFFSKKYCLFCKEKIAFIDYKEHEMLSRCLLENGRIMPARATGTCKFHQKQVAAAVKRARHMALIRYVEDK